MLMADVRRRKVGMVVPLEPSRLGSLKHLLTIVEEFESCGVVLSVEGRLGWSTPAVDDLQALGALDRERNRSGNVFGRLKSRPSAWSSPGSPYGVL
jgi:hypothetical protein